MNSNLDSEIKELIWNEVWFGFNSKDVIIDIVFENFIDNEEPDEEIVKKYLASIIKLKNNEEKKWGERQSLGFYKLSRIFDNLHMDGIIALHNSGYTQSDGISDANEAFDQIVNKAEIIGYCFYHQQDLERLIPEFSIENKIIYSNQNLLLSFGAFNDESDELKKKVAVKIVEKIKLFDLTPKWNNNLETRIEVENLKWEKKVDEEDWSLNRSLYLINEHIPEKRKSELNSEAPKKKWWKFGK